MEYNRQMVLHHVNESKADLLVFPELTLSGYCFESAQELIPYALSVGDPYFEKLAKILKNRHVVIGVAENAGGSLYNSAFLIGCKGVEGVYRKLHLFDREKRLFSSGKSGIPVFTVGGVKISMLVCFDHFFPEAARTAALAGAQVICHPSNLVLPEYGQLTTRVRAIENHVFWLLANRWGCESNESRSLRFTGASQIVSPSGTVTASAPAEENCNLVSIINPQESDNKKLNRFNNIFSDRRCTQYRLG